MNLISRVEIAEISEDPRSSEYKRLSKNLARIEHFCVGVNAKVYDVGIVKRFAGRYFICVFDEFLPLIEKNAVLTTRTDITANLKTRL